MGGYAPYVWGSLSVTLIALVVEVALLSRRRKRSISKLPEKSDFERKNNESST
ncbi:heme exporter protein CcmD [Yanghanlia caeni]|uniref:Heme exporter protein D n=2 Tax=Alcaligenaceae TaxID=506 RepID=A0ABU1D9T7_9BURK|nr:heme exporter protein CcmD [Paracandidimonas soli]MDR4127012.1 heme exporter protein CcmD [Alcaligenaceae bacterium LG-2]MEB2399634.1 heme exporter protein CcmD [Alcaligenaceae bacterium]